MQSDLQAAKVIAEFRAKAVPSIPVALSPELLRLVSGGSPKGGWGTANAAVAAVESSPKGGW
jgi:hypothetical protein